MPADPRTARPGRTTSSPVRRAVGHGVEPVAGRGDARPPGTGVSMVVAAPILVSVPDVSGRSVEEARQSLARYKLALGDQRRRPSEVSPGTVIGQAPAAGTQVRPGTSVNVFVAGSMLVSVPDVIGRSAADARQLLTGTGSIWARADDGSRKPPSAQYSASRPRRGRAYRPGHLWTSWWPSRRRSRQRPPLRCRPRGHPSRRGPQSLRPRRLYPWQSLQRPRHGRPSRCRLARPHPRRRPPWRSRRRRLLFPSPNPRQHRRHASAGASRPRSSSAPPPASSPTGLTVADPQPGATSSRPRRRSRSSSLRTGIQDASRSGRPDRSATAQGYA